VDTSDQRDRVRPFDAVFDRGGVKGIGMVGALAAVEAAGYRVAHAAGVSTGAILAALTAAGYRADELWRLLAALDVTHLADGGRLGRLPFVGPALRVAWGLGVFDGDALLRLLRDLLAAKGVHTFRDLADAEVAGDERRRFRAVVLATDVTRRRLLVLPHDAQEYGVAPEDLEVALAVRMSTAIPFVFRPVRLPHPSGEPSLVLDGGLLGPLPVGLFDGPDEPAWPTFGFRMVRRSATTAVHPVRSPFSLAMGLYFAMIEGERGNAPAARDAARTIAIDALDVRATEFGLSGTRKQALYDAGVAAAEAFLADWDFARYQATYPTDRLRAATADERRSR
jgi:NTE family protein